MALKIKDDQQGKYRIHTDTDVEVASDFEIISGNADGSVNVQAVLKCTLDCPIDPNR